jgi:hypothetical protein
MLVEGRETPGPAIDRKTRNNGQALKGLLSLCSLSPRSCENNQFAELQIWGANLAELELSDPKTAVSFFGRTTFCKKTMMSKYRHKKQPRPFQWCVPAPAVECAAFQSCWKEGQRMA